MAFRAFLSVFRLFRGSLCLRPVTTENTEDTEQARKEEDTGEYMKVRLEQSVTTNHTNKIRIQTGSDRWLSSVFLFV